MQKKIKSKQKNNFFQIFIIAILVCVLGIIINSYLFHKGFYKALTKLNEEPIATITFKYKTAQRKFLDRVIWDRLRQNSPVYNGDTIHTASLSEATIHFIDGNIMELSENTMAQVFLTEDDVVKADFSGGYITFDSSESKNGLKVVAEGKEVSLESGSKIGAGFSSTKEEQTSIQSQELSSTQKAENFSLQVIQGSAKVKTDSDTITQVKEGDGLNITQENTLLPNLVVLNPPLTAKILSFEESSIKIPFEWNITNLEDYLKGNSKQIKTYLKIYQDKTQQNLVYQKEVSNSLQKEVALKPGKYFWKLELVNKTKNKEEIINFQNGKLELYQSLAPSLVVPQQKTVFSYRSKVPSVRLMWNESLQASAYKIEIADNPEMISPIIEQRTSLTSIIISTLQRGTYYWRVTPFYTINRIGFASPSKVQTFSIEQKGSLSNPTLYIPQNNGLINIDKSAKNIAFSWKQESDVASYVIKIANNPEFKKAEIQETISNNYFTLENSKFEKFSKGKWYWTVLSQDEEGNLSKDSEVRTFFAMKGKPEQHVIEPFDGYQSSDSFIRDTVFTWKRNLPENFNTKFQVSSDKDFKTLLYNTDVTGPFIKGITLSIGTYWWRLNSQSTTDNTSLITQARQIKIVEPLKNTIITNPIEKAVARESTPFEFSWQPVEDASYYKIKVFNTKNNNLALEDTIYSTSFTTDLFNNKNFKDKTYYKIELQAHANALPGISSRRTGLLTESTFYFNRLRPVEVVIPTKNAKIKGEDAVLSPSKAKWQSVDTVSSAQFVLRRKDKKQYIDVLKVPTDEELLENKNLIAPSEILLDTPDGLRQGEYEIIVYAKTLDGIDISNTDERYKGKFTVLPVSPLNTVQNLKTEPNILNLEYLSNPQNPRTIKLSWQKVSNATEYELSIKTKNERTLISKTIKDKTSYEINFSDFKENDRKLFSKGTFIWTVKGIRRIDTNNDGIVDKIFQESPEAESTFETDIPSPKKSKVKGAVNPYGM